MHNVLLCPTDEADRAFILNENLEQSEWTENDEALANPEMCYMIKKIQPKEHSEMEKNQITGVKNALKELSSEQKHINTRDDRAAFVQVGRIEYVRLLHETRCYESMSDNESFSDKSGSAESEHEFVTATESEREKTQSVEGSTESDPREQMTSNSEEENTKEEREKKVSIKKFKNRRKNLRENWIGLLDQMKVRLNLWI